MSPIRRAFVLGVSAFCLLLLLAGHARSQEVPRSYLYLEVKDTSGNAVADASINIVNDASARAGRGEQNLKTDKDGLAFREFAGFGLPSLVKLQVSKSGYLPYEQLFFACCQRSTFSDEINSAGEFRPSSNRRISIVLLKAPTTPAERKAVEAAEQRRQLLMAVRSGDTVSLRKFLRAGVSANTTDDRGVPVIAWAAVRGDADTIELLLASGAKVRDKNSLGHKALLLYLTEGLWWGSKQAADKSAVSQREDVIRKLIEAGAGVNEQDSRGVTVLHKAVVQVPDALSVEAIRAILKAGASVNAADGSGRTPLIAAARTNSPETISLLAAAGANVNAKDKEGLSALMYASGYNESMVRALLAAGANVNDADKEGRNALLHAIAWHYDDSTLGAVRALLAAGADTNVVDKNGQNALMLAVRGRSIQTVQALLEAGARALINVKDKQGRTALSYAVDGYENFPKPEIVEALLAAGADVNAADEAGQTVLMFAARVNVPGSLKRLLAAGAHINAQDKKGWTALMYAIAFPVYWRPEEMIGQAKILVEAGADLKIKNNQGRTALMMARENGIQTIISLLEEAERRR